MLISLLVLPAASEGILVRFLAGAPEDSLARYDVYRASGPGGAEGPGGLGSPGGEAVLIGSVAAGSTDTLSFPDSMAARGMAFRYTIRAVDRMGMESDPSDTTWAGFPRLGLPDTLRASGGVARFVLPAEAHPLRGYAPLALSLADSSRVRLAFDAAAGSLELRTAGGRPDTVRIVIQGDYFGKFADTDTAVFLMAAASQTAIPSAPPVSGAGHIALAKLPAGAGWLLEGLPGRVRVELVSPAGRGIAAHTAVDARFRLEASACGGNSGSSPCLLLVRDRSGSLLGRFQLSGRSP